jgi:Zn-dependent oligopeptidase
VKDEAGSLLGYFYLDLWPRASKFSHAACWPLQPACDVPGRAARRPCVTALVCNFPKPGADGKPPLLEHSEVVTFFHEVCVGASNLARLVKFSLARSRVCISLPFLSHLGAGGCNSLALYI